MKINLNTFTAMSVKSSSKIAPFIMMVGTNLSDYYNDIEKSISEKDLKMVVTIYEWSKKLYKEYMTSLYNEVDTNSKKYWDPFNEYWQLLNQTFKWIPKVKGGLSPKSDSTPKSRKPKKSSTKRSKSTKSSKSTTKSEKTEKTEKTETAN